MRLKLTCKQCRRNIEIEGEGISHKSIACPNCSGQLEIPSNVLDVDQELGGFRVEKHLGSGSMGCVYLATQVSMDRKVALKVLPPEMTKDQQDLDNFLHEVRMLAKLDHPNIVAAFEAGEDDGNYFMAMTYVDGETLEDYIEREGPMDEYDALQICRKIAGALQYAWEKHQILHRDIKPANIIVDGAMEPRLLDMGISKVHSDEESPEQSSGFLLGTPHYMAPEQAKAGEAAVFQSDMYALGCTVYNLATGQVPYDGETVLDVLTKHALDPFPSPKKLVPGLSDGFVELLRKMMAKKPEDRHADWAALLADVDRVIAGDLPKGVKLSSSSSHQRRSHHAAKADAVLQHVHSARNVPLWKRLVIVGAAIVFVFVMLGVGAKVVLNLKANREQKQRDEALARQKAEQERQAELRRRREEVLRQAQERKRRREDKEKQLTATQERARLERFQKLLDEARALEKAEPQNYTPIIKKYEELIIAALNTRFEELGLQEADRLRKLLAAAKAKVMASLDGKAKPFIARHNYPKAIAIYRDYAGPYAPETEPERTAKVTELTEVHEQQQLIAAQNASKIEHLADLIAKALIRLDFSKARNRLNDAARDSTLTVSPRFRQIKQAVETCEGMSQTVLASFAKDAGKEITVGFSRGRERIQIKGVEGNMIAGYKLVTIGESKGRIKRDFRPRDLHPSEIYRRLGDKDTPNMGVLRGVLAAKGGRTDRARTHFTKAPAILREPLLFFLNDNTTSFEDDAARRFNEILLQSEIKAGSLPSMLYGVRALRLNGSRGLRLKADVAKFIRRYADSNVATRNRVFLEQLERRLDNLGLPAITDDQVQEMLAQLRQANRGALRSEVAPGYGGPVLSLAGNKRLRDLSALAGKPIVELNLAGSGIANLMPLADVPLTKLDLSDTRVDNLHALKTVELTSLKLAGTRVTDLQPLISMPLLTLDLSRTNVRDLQPLTKLPLLELNLQGCTRIHSLEPLLQIPTLQWLCLPAAHDDIPMLRRHSGLSRIGFSPDAMPTKFRFWRQYDARITDEMSRKYEEQVQAAIAKVLAQNPDIANEQARFYHSHRYHADGIEIRMAYNSGLQNIEGLAGLPICEFTAFRCRNLFDVSPLQRAPLKRLNIRSTKVRSLSALRTCPIEWIDARYTGITDWSVLARWPLRGAWISGEDLKNIDFLQGKKLTELGLYHTNVKDLSVLEGMPLTYLSLYGSDTSNLRVLRKLADLRTLDISVTKVKELSYLKYVPKLQNFYAERTEINSFSVLRNFDLKRVNLAGTSVRLLSMLEDKKLTYLDISNTSVRKIDHLQGMPLRTLRLDGTKVTDLSPLKGAKLSEIHLHNTDVDDLTPLRGMPLTEIRLDNCEGIKDVAILATMKSLENVTVPRGARNIRLLRNLPELKYIDYELENNRWNKTKAEFFFGD